jgi:SAM-dependent methyltransferase
MANFIPVNEFNRFKYQIDIDGNSNSWPGLFQKLLTGSPVLKVTSPYGFRQWYYDRLKPWVNFVPVAADMSDLVEKVKWLKAHDDAARQIGKRGRALAESLDYPGELKRAGRTINAALRYFSGRPEAVLRFGTTEDDNVYLGEGWSEPEEGGVSAVGSESRLELPRPIAAEDFVMTLDVSPVSELEMSAPQRLTVLANGEIVRQATLSARQELRCPLPRRVIDHAEKLAITLLHPDGMCGASAARPLDTRALSVTLHRLELMPVSLHGTSAVAEAAVEAAPTRPSQQGAVMRALYGRDVWHAFVPVRPRAPEVQGWNGRYPVFGRLLDEIPNTTMIDVGVWKGQSTIFVAELMRQRRMDGCIVAVDAFLAEEHWPADGKLFARHPGGRPNVYETFLDNVFYAGVAELVVPFPAQSIAAARLLAQRGVKAGLIHLDSSRDYAEALRDAEAYWQLLEPGGYLVGDDYGPSWPGVIKAAGEFAAKVGLELEIQSPKWLLRKPVRIEPRLPE